MSCCPVNLGPTLEGVTSDAGAVKTSGLTTFYQAGPAKARVGLLARLGKLGYAVLLVDLTGGDWFMDPPTRDSITAWMDQNTFENRLAPRINDAIANGLVHRILSNNATIAVLSDVIDSPDVKHDWVNRGDLEQLEVKTSVTKAWHRALGYLQTVCPV